MFGLARTRAKTGQLKPPLSFGVLLAGLTFCLVLCAPGRAAALSNLGPDPAELGAQPGDTYSYVLRSKDYAAASIPSTSVPIYFVDNAGTKTITITDGDLCTDPRGSAPATGGNQSDLMQVPGADGTLAAQFYVQNDVTKSNTNPVFSHVSSADTCYASTITLSFNASSVLTLDPSTKLYYAYFKADIDGTLTQSENRFSIALTPGSYVGYSKRVPANQMGISRDTPPNVLRNYEIPFAPDCSLTTQGTAYAVLYDLDNGSAGPQGGNMMQTYIEDTPDDGPVERLPLTFTTGTNPSSKAVPATGDQNGYTITAGPGSYVYVHFEVKPYHTYKLGMTNVYGLNVLQFQLPYDSIYAASSHCPPPPRTAADVPALPPPQQPYFQTTGGDVAAGASFATDTVTPCTTAKHINEAGIVGWNYDGVPDFSGAGGQLAAYALGYVQDYVTGQGSGNVPAGTETNRLTFANTNYNGSVNIASGLFGGMFGTAPCADFWNDHPPAYTPMPAGPVSGWADGAYLLKGPLTIGGATIPPGKHLTIYVQGDVALNGDITYTPAAYAGRSQIPSFRLIVNGVIYIDSTVGRLDGLYAAIPNTLTGANQYNAPIPGTISTCSTGFNIYDPSQVANNSMQSICGKQLVFNGSVVAQQLWMLRTLGTLSTHQPAEVFNYDPEIWLAPSGSGQYAPNYQSVIGLPPIL